MKTLSQFVVHTEFMALPHVVPGTTLKPRIKDAIPMLMCRLVGNLMSNNFSCLTAAGAKITVWRLSFDHQATGAIAHILAQVRLEGTAVIVWANA